MVQYELHLRPLSARGRRCHQSGIGRTQSVLTPPVGWPSSTSCTQTCKKNAVDITPLDIFTKFNDEVWTEQTSLSILLLAKECFGESIVQLLLSYRNPLYLWQCRFGRSWPKSAAGKFARARRLFTREPRSRLRGRPKPCQNVMPISSVPWKKN